jgi:endoglucanase
MGFEIRRGTNVSHWLSQSDRRGEERRAWFTRPDVERIAATGFDHVRIPVDEVQLWDEDGGREQEGFELLEQGLEWCAESGLRAVVDLHIVRAHSFDADGSALFEDAAEQERFCELWRDLSAALAQRSVERVAYEILNEPVASDHEQWNRLAARALAVIREREPERVVALGSNSFDQPSTFPVLRVPSDPHLILTFHHYDPILVTHYRAHWNAVREYTGPIGYPGEIVTPEAWRELSPAARAAARDMRVCEGVDAVIAPAVETARTAGLPLWCGEFGALPTSPWEIRERWYRDALDAFERHGIAWTSWDYKGDFGLFTGDGDPTAIHALLTGGA